MATDRYGEYNNFSHKYLIVFAQEHLDFRTQELQTICSIFGMRLDDTTLCQHDVKNPFLIVHLRDDHAAKLIASRSILIRSILRLFGSGGSLEILIETLKQYQSDDILSPCRTDDSFKINVESFNKRLNSEKKLQFIESLSFLPLEGVVQLSQPSTTFSLILDYSDTKTDSPRSLFFGRLVGNGQRHLIKHYSLKTRHFIGNTSMDPQLALIMANMAKCEDGMLVYDPFVGTVFLSTKLKLRTTPLPHMESSILLACSHYGAYSAGSDIDRTLLLGRGHPSRAQAAGKWRGRDESVWSNFKMYNLHSRYIDVWMGDQICSPLKRKPLFDAIVTDPPYGIREGSKKSRKGKCPEIDENPSIGNKLPTTQACALSEALYSLLDFSARYLVPHGRLVYWLPTYRSTYCEELVPSHPCLKLLHNSEQTLSANVSRRLITMEKIAEAEDGRTNHVDNHIKEVYDQFRNNYFNLEKNVDVG